MTGIENPHDMEGDVGRMYTELNMSSTLGLLDKYLERTKPLMSFFGRSSAQLCVVQYILSQKEIDDIIKTYVS